MNATNGSYSNFENYSEQPWEPWFDMPDYTKAGKILLDFSHSYPMDDTPDLYYASDITTQVDVNELLTKSGGFIVDLLPLPDLGELSSVFQFDPLTLMTLKRSGDDDYLVYPVEEEPKPRATHVPPTSRSRSSTLHSRKPSQSSQSSQPTPALAVPHYMTRAATRRQATAEQPSRPATRSNSGSSGRATPSTGHSTRSNTPVGTAVAGASRLPRCPLSLATSNAEKDPDDIAIHFKDTQMDEDFQFEV